MKMYNLYIHIKINIKAEDHCHCTGEYRSTANSVCNLKYSVPKKIPIVFHNGSNYDYNFIIKVLAEKFKKQFPCLGETTGKYIRLTDPIEKEITRTDKNGEEITKNISSYYNLLMTSSLSNLVNNLSEGIHTIRCKFGLDDKKM